MQRLKTIEPVMPLRTTPYKGQGKFQFCEVCGGPWRPWAGSVLPCHARCLYAPADQDTLLEVCEGRGTRPLKEIAEALGVTLGILNANTRQAIKRRSSHARD